MIKLKNIYSILIIYCGTLLLSGCITLKPVTKQEWEGLKDRKFYLTSVKHSHWGPGGELPWHKGYISKGAFSDGFIKKLMISHSIKEIVEALERKYNISIDASEFIKAQENKQMNFERDYFHLNREWKSKDTNNNKNQIKISMRFNWASSHTLTNWFCQLEYIVDIHSKYLEKYDKEKKIGLALKRPVFWISDEVDLKTISLSTASENAMPIQTKLLEKAIPKIIEVIKKGSIFGGKSKTITINQYRVMTGKKPKCLLK